MKLLIIGGTRFVGRALVEAAIRMGHEITMFNRGQSNPDLFPGVTSLKGDRDGGLDALANGTWEAVIDTCGYIPRLTRDSARYLADRIEHYTFISTISVYGNPVADQSDESAPLATLADETTEEVTGETYGGLKVLCEQSIDEEMNGRSLHIRAGLIVGPHDMTDRFTYWPHRVSQGGSVLVPGVPGAQIQFVDARDLADFTVRATEARLTGAYNVTGPNYKMTMQEMVETSQDVSNSDVDFVYVDEQFLLDEEVRPFADLPFWVPEADAGFLKMNVDKAIAAGLAFRPLPDTIRDTLAWRATRPADHEWRAGISLEREAGLLKKWTER